MKTRTTIALVALFAGLLAWYLLVERHAKPPEEAAREAKRLFTFDEKQVRSLKIVRPEGTVRLERTEDQKWRMTDPVPARADRWAADAAAGAPADPQQARALKNDRGEKRPEEKGAEKPPARGGVVPGPPGGPPERNAGGGAGAGGTAAAV